MKIHDDGNLTRHRLLLLSLNEYQEYVQIDSISSDTIFNKITVIFMFLHCLYLKHILHFRSCLILRRNNIVISV